MASVFHQGELWVQAQAGVAAMANRVGRIIRDYLPDGFGDFLAERRLIIVASADQDGCIWASPLTGEPGFIQQVDEHTVYVAALPKGDDPLHAHLAPGLPLGLVAIEFATRERVRLNGQVEYVFENGFMCAPSRFMGTAQNSSRRARSSR